MKTMHTDSAYTGFSITPEIERPLSSEDTAADRILLENETHREEENSDEVKVSI